MSASDPFAGQLELEIQRPNNHDSLPTLPADGDRRSALVSELAPRVLSLFSSSDVEDIIIQKGLPASQAYDLIFEDLDDVANFTFIDACAGAGGPTPPLEAHLNQTLRS